MYRMHSSRSACRGRERGAPGGPRGLARVHLELSPAMGSSAVGNLMPRSEAPGTMAFRPSAAHRELASRLRKAARPKRGFDLRAYLGSPVPALGVRPADAGAIRKAFVRSPPNPSAAAAQ